MTLHEKRVLARKIHAGAFDRAYMSQSTTDKWIETIVGINLPGSPPSRRAKKTGVQVYVDPDETADFKARQCVARRKPR